MTALWRIELLGQLRAVPVGLFPASGSASESVPGAITRFRSRQTGALLAYLAYFRHRSHPRDLLIELLWPEADLDAARNNLRVSIASLRRQLEPPGIPPGRVLRADRSFLQLDPEYCATDVAEFEAALAVSTARRNETHVDRSEPLATAVELYRGELLPGYYEEWILPERQRLAEAYLQALGELIAATEAKDDLHTALQYALRAVGGDPLREEARLDLMRLLIAAGQPETALRQYQEFEQLFHRELDASPGAELRALARSLELRSRDQHIPQPEPSPSVPTPTLSPTLTTGGSGTPLTPLSSLQATTVTLLLCRLAAPSAGASSSTGEPESALLAAAEREPIRQIFIDRGGTVLTEEAETLGAVFSRVSAALDAAVAAQQTTEPTSAEAPGLQLAMHSGELNPASPATGPETVERARRLLAAGHPGQILISETAAALLRHDLAPGQRLIDRGLYRLHPVGEPERIFQLDAPSLPRREFPPLNAPSGRSVSLPLPFTRFFGREAEIERLVEQLGGIHHGDTETQRGTRESEARGEGVKGQPRVSALLTPAFLSVSPCLRGEFASSSSPPARLVTLTGPGGSGKTRLALEVSRRLSEPLRGDVWFVPLAEVTDPLLIPDQLLMALRLPRLPGINPLDQVITFLVSAPADPDRPALLVLDNFEHLVHDGARVVQTLLEQVERLRVLVTSRRRLELSGEQEIAVGPLPIPDASRQTPVASEDTDPTCRLAIGPSELASGVWRLATLTACPSVRLFLDRAQMACPDFQITPGNAAAVARLCERLEGLPLALELAAARARTLTPAQMLARLEQGFDLLVSRHRDADPRHHSLKATLDWSYQLLSPELRRLFARLSVFRGGWTLDSAEAVCGDFEPQLRGGAEVRAPTPAVGAGRVPRGGRVVGAGPRGDNQGGPLSRREGPPTSSSDECSSVPMRGSSTQNSTVLDGLEQLQECSLVTVEWSPPREKRDAAPSSPPEGDTRRFRMLESLRDYAAAQLSAEEQDELARQHLQHHLSLAEQAEQELLGAGQAVWLDRLEREHDNLRAGLEWAAARAAAPTAAAGCSPEEALVLGLRLGGALWGFWWVRGHLSEGRQRLARLLSLVPDALQLDPRGTRVPTAKFDRALAKAQACAAVLAHYQGDFAAARSLYEESLTRLRGLGDPWGMAFSLTGLAFISEHHGDFAAVYAYQEEGLPLWRQLGNWSGIAWSLNNLADVAFRQGDLARARALFEESLALRRALGDEWGAAFSLAGLGDVALGEGDRLAAIAYHEQSLALRRTVDDRPGMAWSLHHLGTLARDRDDLQAARSLYSECLAIHRAIGARWGIATALASLAEVVLLLGNRVTARELLSECLVLRLELGDDAGAAACRRLQSQAGDPPHG